MDGSALLSPQTHKGRLVPSTQATQLRSHQEGMRRHAEVRNYQEWEARIEVFWKCLFAAEVRKAQIGLAVGDFSWAPGSANAHQSQ